MDTALLICKNSVSVSLILLVIQSWGNYRPMGISFISGIYMYYYKLKDNEYSVNKTLARLPTLANLAS